MAIVPDGMSWVGCLAFLALLFACCSAAQAQVRQDDLCPFVLPWDDATPGPTDLSGWNHKPAGKFGPVRAGADGHLYVGDERIRFFGVDLTFDATMPTKENAEGIAARSAKFGINIVRFHIMDMAHYPRGIFAAGPQSTRDLDPDGLDRLDYFVSQLEQNGIYVNMNTLCYRYINQQDGLPAEIDQIPGAPDRNIMGFFYEPAMELQKEFARKLLTHRNPYTGLTYVEDPAVAFVEIHNENGLIHAWLGGRLDGLPQVFLTELQRKWNDWLAERYGTTDKLREAWDRTAEPLGRELLVDGDFATGLDQWVIELHHNAQGRMDVVTVGPDAPQGGRAVRVTITKPPEAGWPIRFEQQHLAVRKGQAYTLTFRARAEEPLRLQIGFEQAHEPWGRLASPAPADLTTEWQEFRYGFICGADDENARVIFDFDLPAGVFYLADVSFREGGLVGLGDGEGLEGGTVPLLLSRTGGRRTADAHHDWVRFLWDTENSYWQTMYHYYKNDLGVKGLVIGTATGCSTPNMMAGMDCSDAHAYWAHPVFPNRPWDENDWYVSNEAMVNDAGGNLTDLASRRILKQPQCITEYGHAEPNSFGGEAEILYAAYAALQDWDYLSLSRYGSEDGWDQRRIMRWFNIHQNPVRMAGLVPAMAMFRRGDVRPAEEQVVAKLGLQAELDRLPSSWPWQLVNAGDAGLAPQAALLHRVAIATEGKQVPGDALRPEQVSLPNGRFVSDTGELDWDVSTEGRGVVTVNTAESKAVVGFVGGKRFDLGGVVVEPGDTMQAGFSAVTVTVMEGSLPPVGGAGACRLLITATGHVQNTGWGWEELSDNRVTVRRNWGEPPTLVEVVPLRITLPVPADGAEAWALDERGQRGESVAVTADAAGLAVLALGPPHRTLWYEVVAR
jgi:hypothetical protein